MLTNENFINRLKENNVKHIPLEEYKGNKTKIKFMCGDNSKHIFMANPSYIYNATQACPYCNLREIFVGETDMWTTNPNLAQMLLNKDDGYKYCEGSSKKVNWLCPKCHQIIKNKIIKNVNIQGLCCPYCSDGMSFGEKFVSSMLSQLNLDFIFDNTLDWSNGKRFDFYVPNYSLIIEVNGIQHYEQTFIFHRNNHKNRTVYDEKLNDKNKKENAIKHGIKYYVELDCRESNKDFIKNSVENSILAKIFDLHIIDWNKCLEHTFTSNVILCSDLWNSGIKNTKVISERTGIHISSVICYLKKAQQIGLCDYRTNYLKHQRKEIVLDNVINIYLNNTKSISQIALMLNISPSYVMQLLTYANEHGLCEYNKKNISKHAHKRKIICKKKKKIYNSIVSVEKDGYKRNCVCNCLCGLSKTAHGNHWKYIN